MKRLVGTHVFARQAAQLAPAGYLFVPGGFGFAPGRVMPGPYTDTCTTVCLLETDDGAWFKRMVEQNSGVVREEGA